MDRTGEHHVTRIEETVTAANRDGRAGAVAVPDVHHREQVVGGRHRDRQSHTTGDHR